MFVMLSPLGPSAYTLSAAGKPIGWVRGRTMHVGGFATAGDSLAAGDAGYAALSRWVARRRGEVSSGPPLAYVAGTDADTFEWFGIDGTCVARLVSRSDAGGFGIELTLPPGLLMAVAIGAVAQICDAMLAIKPEAMTAARTSSKPQGARAARVS